jgi:quaternary ammonium compound-resistance protein SugE
MVGGRGKGGLVQMAWLCLLAAGLVEVAFALSIGPTEGFTRLPQTALCFVLGAGSIYLLTRALKTLPIGTAYAAFTGIGAVGTVVLGLVLAGDPGEARADRVDRGGDSRPQAVLGGLM